MGAAPIIGLVGQVCSGKSAVSAALARRGARVYDADRYVHALYENDEVKKEVREVFGNEVFTEAGEVDRKKLGALVFADPNKLKALTEQIIFPRTAEKMWQEIDSFRNQPDGATALVLDAPTLFEAGRAGVCDEIIFVEAPRAMRVHWARTVRGWSAGELERRESRLMDEAEKRTRCTRILQNDGGLEELDRKVGPLWTDLISRPS